MSETTSKYCRNCGKPVDAQAVACMSCGLAPSNGNAFCRNCGADTNPAAIACVKCGASTKGVVVMAGGGSSGGMVHPSEQPKDPVLMGVLSALIPGLGQIILGQTAKGIVMLVVATFLTVGTCGWGLLLYPLNWVVSGLDAYKIATKLKQGNPVGGWDFF